MGLWRKKPQQVPPVPVPMPDRLEIPPETEYAIHVESARNLPALRHMVDSVKIYASDGKRLLMSRDGDGPEVIHDQAGWEQYQRVASLTDEQLREMFAHLRRPGVRYMSLNAAKTALDGEPR